MNSQLLAIFFIIILSVTVPSQCKPLNGMTRIQVSDFNDIIWWHFTPWFWKYRNPVNTVARF